MKMRMVTAIVPAIVLTISLSPCDTHYVSPTGSNQYPYTTPETAASKIQDAIDAAEYADSVAVAEGEYNESIRMKQGVALQGAGPELTAIVYEPSQKEATVLSAKDASISGFSIIGGRWGVRQAESEDHPFQVVNCSISATTYTGLGFQGELIVVDSEISNNVFRGLSLWGGSSATLVNCTFLENGDAACYLMGWARLSLNHCTITGNAHCCLWTGSAGAISVFDFSGEVEVLNCLIHDNVDDCLTKDKPRFRVSYSVVADPELHGVWGNICGDPGFVGYGAFDDADNSIHVDSAYSGPEDGTRDKPFTTVRKALGLFDYELGKESCCLGAASDGTNIGSSPYFVPTRPSGCPHVLINLAPGTYNEAELCLRNGERLKGASADSTIVDAGGRGHPYEFKYVFRAGNGVVIEDLTIAGATWGVHPDHSSPTISDCIVRNCYGGFFCYASSASITRCLIRNCEGGIVWADSSDTVSNCTIVANEDSAIHSWRASPARISDSILWYNGGDFSGTVGSEMVQHCNIQGPELVGANGNISTDPLFLGWAGCGGDEATVHVNPAAPEPGNGTWERPFRSVSQALAYLPEYDYHLALGSPCLAAGKFGEQIGAFPDDVPSATSVPRLRIQTAPGTTEETDMTLPPAIDLVGAGMELSVLEGGSLTLGPSSVITDLAVIGAEGAGISCTSSSRAIISSCRVADCEYGVRVSAADLLQDCEILNNRRTGVGAGGPVSRCLIAGNGETGVDIYGGGPIAVECCVIAENGDVGVFLRDSSSIVRQCTILRNKRAGIATSDSSPSIDSCVVRGNGCGIILFDSSVLVTNCLIFGHVADEPGTDAYDPLGVGLPCSYAGGSRVINTTIFGNSRGVACGEGSRPELINCIVRGNHDSDAVLTDSELWVTYSNVGGWTEGVGNIDADPRFLDPENGDFRLRPDSPCVDAGTVDELMPPLDLVGMHRVMFGGKSLRPDMGAFEYYINDLAPLAGGQGMLLTWSSLAGKSYSVLHSEDLLTWNTAAEGIVSWGDVTTSWMDSPSCGTQPPPGQARRRYYRVVEEE
jgi:hypothetical protein